jgi:Electron transfer DM13
VKFSSSRQLWLSGTPSAHLTLALTGAEDDERKRRRSAMIPKIELAVALVLLTLVLQYQPATAQESVQHNNEVKTLETGVFHGKVHPTSGRATVYQEADGKLVLRLTNFKTSNGPDVHVVLIAAKDADDDANFLKNDTARIELGKLKGNEGDQNYDIPANTDLSKFQTVSIYCVRFNANFGAAPLEKF